VRRPRPFGLALLEWLARASRFLADRHPEAARAHFLPCVYYAPVAPRAPVGRIALVAVSHVDLVATPAAPHHVGVFGVLVGQNQVVAALRDDLVVLTVADPL
jgi:hypothetical protein